MASRDSQTVILSRQAIVLVTAVGVGLLTLCYVLGVQVGKQSAALRRPQTKGTGEELQELPASVADQLKAFEATAAGAGPKAPTPAPEPVPQPAPAGAGDPADAAPAAGKPEPAKPEPAKPVADKKPAPDKKPEPTGQWTLQLVSTPDAAEARRMAARVKDAGFPTATVSEKGLFKVRLTRTGSRDNVDATALKLKNRGFKPFAVRAE